MDELRVNWRLYDWDCRVCGKYYKSRENPEDYSLYDLLADEDKNGTLRLCPDCEQKRLDEQRQNLVGRNNGNNSLLTITPEPE